MTNKSGATSSRQVWSFIGVAATVVTLWAVAWGLGITFIEDWTTRGLFGDMFGAVNALFSGLAFAGVLYTIALQREELQLQRRELEMTREELQRSATAQERSEAALRDQAEILRLSARGMTLSALLEHYSLKIQATGTSADRHVLERRQVEYVDTLEREFEKYGK